MKAGKVIGSIAGALFVLVACHVQAQGSSPAVSSPAMASAPGASPKAVKAADRRLQKDVLRALSKTKGLKASGITVRAHNGAVTLQGTVPEQSQTELAARTAQAVAGVTSVRNAITVRDEGQ